MGSVFCTKNMARYRTPPQNWEWETIYKLHNILLFFISFDSIYFVWFSDIIEKSGNRQDFKFKIGFLWSALSPPSPHHHHHPSFKTLSEVDFFFVFLAQETASLAREREQATDYCSVTE